MTPRLRGLLVVVAAAGACQIFDLAPAPCDVDAHCGPGLVCASGTCGEPSDDEDDAGRPPLGDDGGVDADGGGDEEDAGNGTPPAPQDATYRVANDGPFSFILSATPASGDTVFTITQGPAHGDLVDDTPPTITYLPDDGYVGADEIVFTASRGGASAAATITFDVVQWWDRAWTARAAVDVSGAGLTEAVVDVPILLQVPAALADRAAAAGRADLRVVDADQTTLLAVDAVPSSTGETAPLWVKTTLQPGATKRLWVYAGNTDGAARPPPAATTTWSADYRGVWHLDDAWDDATSYGHDLVAFGGVVDGGAQIGGGARCDGAGGRLHISEATDLQIRGALTLAAWVRVDALEAEPNSNVIVSQGTDSSTDVANNYLYYLWIDGATARPGLLWQHGGFDDIVSATQSIAGLQNDWKWIVATRSAAGEVRFYVDGAQLGAPVTDADAPSGGENAPFTLCADDADTARWNLDGTIDEVHVAAAARSPSFVAAQYASMAGTSTTFGPVEELSD